MNTPFDLPIIQSPELHRRKLLSILNAIAGELPSAGFGLVPVTTGAEPVELLSDGAGVAILTVVTP